MIRHFRAVCPPAAMPVRREGSGWSCWSHGCHPAVVLRSVLPEPYLPTDFLSPARAAPACPRLDSRPALLQAAACPTADSQAMPPDYLYPGPAISAVAELHQRTARLPHGAPAPYRE